MMEKTDFKNLLLPDPWMSELPQPRKTGNKIEVHWNAVPLFFNIPDPAHRPAGYRETLVEDAENFLFLNIPGHETLEEFMKNYWYNISYGKFSFGIGCPEDGNGNLFIADLNLERADGSIIQMDNWDEIIKLYLKDHAEKVWKAGNENTTPDGRRWIPSVFLVNRNYGHAKAYFGGYTMKCNGKDYVVGDMHVMRYNFDIFENDLTTLTDDAAKKDYWQVIAHEFSHNFMEQGDLYGPAGAVGYWDHLGDGCTYGAMSEICSLYKFAADWLSFKEQVMGPTYVKKSLELSPYTTSGDAILVMPDPFNTPHEFFLLEYRKSTGNEPWRPDGALTEEGLLIFHVNTMFPMNHTPWHRREAPPLDVEMANFRDKGTTLRIYFDKVAGNLFPQPGNDKFTPYSQPSSNFYGHRSSGLSITDIRVSGNKLKFDLEISGYSQPGWLFMDSSRYLTGRFTPESKTEGAEIIGWNNSHFALLHEREGQFLTLYSEVNDLNGFWLHEMKKMISGDFDGDGQDELYIRTTGSNAILKYKFGRFERIQQYLALWDPSDADKEYAAKLLPDKKKQIILHTGNNLVIWQYAGGQMEVIQQFTGNIGTMPIDESLEIIPAFLKSSNWQDLVLFNGSKLSVFHMSQASFQLEEIDHFNGSIGDWNFSIADQLVPTDLDGDQREEIFIKSASKMGYLKLDNLVMSLKYIKQEWINHSNGLDESRVYIKRDDIILKGKFRPDREGIYLVSGNFIYQLLWDDAALDMQIQKHVEAGKHVGFDKKSGDQYIVDDFHRIGPDINVAELGDLKDFNSDGFDDIFIVNRERALLLSPNYIVTPREIKDQFTVIWRLDRQIPLLNPGSRIRSVVAAQENSLGRNMYFIDLQSGAYFSRELFVNMIEEGLYPEYHIRIINGVKTPVSNPNRYENDNLDRV